MRPNVEYTESKLEGSEHYLYQGRPPFEKESPERLEAYLHEQDDRSKFDDSFVKPSMTVPKFESCIFLWNASPGRDFSQIFTFLPHVTGMEEPVSVRTDPQRLTPAELRDGLLGVSSIIDISDDWFTLQYGGSRGGMGLENFLSTLEMINPVPDDVKVGSQDIGIAVYVLRYGVDKYVQVNLEFGLSDASIRSFSLGFRANGYPVDYGLYRQIAGQFGVTELHHRDTELGKFTIRPDPPKLLEVSDRFVSKRKKDTRPVVTGLLVKNPLQGGDIHDGAERRANPERDTRSRSKSPYESLESYDNAYVRLANPHPMSETHEYKLTEITVRRLDSVFDGFDLWNVGIEAEW